MRRSLFPLLVLGMVVTFTFIQYEDDVSLRKSNDNFNQRHVRYNSLRDSFVRLEKSNHGTEQAYKELEDVNHRNEDSIKTCLAGWNRAIVDVEHSALFIDGLATQRGIAHPVLSNKAK